jgi:hypothetical protein
LATGLANDGINWSPPTGLFGTQFLTFGDNHQPVDYENNACFPGAQYRLGEYILHGPKLDAATEMVRDSANAAGAPSRNNVWEYGFPESASPSGTLEPVSPQIATVSVPSAFYNAVLAAPVQSDLAGSINFNLISWDLGQQAGPVQWPDASSATPSIPSGSLPGSNNSSNGTLFDNLSQIVGSYGWGNDQTFQWSDPPPIQDNTSPPVVLDLEMHRISY